MRLWRQLALVMAVLAVAPAAVLGLLAIETVNDEWRPASEQRVRRDAQRRADDLAAWYADQRGLVASFPTSFAPDDLAAWSDTQQSGFLSLVFQLVQAAEQVVLVNDRGELVVEPVPADLAARSPARVNALVRRLPLAKAAASPGEVHAGHAWVPLERAVPAVPLAIRLTDVGDRPLFLGVELTLPLDAATTAPGERAFGLLGSQGEPLLTTSPLVQPARLRALLGTFEEFAIDAPEPAHGALASVPGSPGWTLVVVEPERALLRLSERISRQIGIGVLIATLAGILAALGTALTVSRPVERLRETSLKLADGELGVQAQIARNDEIGDLAEAFDHMSRRLREDQARIAAQQAEIEVFNAELQSRVEERTQKLREAQDQLVRESQLAAVAELGAGFAHDLNNPLTGVIGLAQVLRERHPNDPMVESLESEALRCREVVNAMQRATSLEVDLTNTVETDVAEIVRRATEWVAPSYGQRGVRLEVVGRESGIRTRVDPEHGTRILSQILQSVRSGLPDGSTVTVRVTTEEDRPAIRVEADRKVAEQPQHRDDWLTASRAMWVTHQLVARLGGDLLRPDEGRVWQWVL